MLKRLLARSGVSATRPSAGGWIRSSEGFSKEARFSDGAITAMLVGGRDAALLGEAYAELKGLLDSRYRAMVALVASYSFALIAFFDASKSFSISGLTLKSQYWPHIAIAIISFFSWRFSELNSKSGFHTALFDHCYVTSSPGEKARMLLRYPMAFPAFQFNRTIRGFPPHVWPKSWPEWEGWTLKILIFLVATIWFVPIAIYAFGIIQIWESRLPTPVLAKIYVALLIAVGLLSVANPIFTSFKRRYVHYGLSNAISGLPKARQSHWHRRIAKIRLERDARSFDQPA